MITSVLLTDATSAHHQAAVVARDKSATTSNTQVTINRERDQTVKIACANVSCFTLVLKEMRSVEHL